MLYQFLMQAIKKAKDLRIRAIVKDLKRQKETGNSQKEANLEKELHHIKSTAIDSIWETLCDKKSLDSINEPDAFYKKSKPVVEQLENLTTVLAKIDEAQKGVDGDNKDSGNESEEVVKEPTSLDNGKHAGSSKQSNEDVAKKKSMKPKNRMGQRARQRLAEKLHGSDAKHRQKIKDVPKTSRKDIKMKKKTTLEAPLHPSWAAKKQQESIKINVDSVSSKKIVFD